MIGQHKRAKHKREPEIAPAEAEAGESEGGKRAADDITDGGEYRDEEGVPEELPEAHLQPRPAANITAEIDRRGNERGRAEQLVLRPEGT
ncbi:hypothetical protein D3C86_1382480 [compost metagenome]